MKRDALIPRNNRLFQFYTGTELFWPDYPQEIVEAFNNATGRAIPYKVTDPDGGVKYISSLMDWSTESSSRASSDQVMKSIKKYGHYQGYVFEQIDLKDYDKSHFFGTRNQ